MEPLRWALLVCTTLVVSSSVAVSGTVGWVGLAVPHFARMLVVGPSLTSAEIPLGVITALIGAPVFAWLLRRTHARGWGHD